jgi:hypothetical protein
MAVGDLSRVTLAMTGFLQQAILARGNVAGTLTATAAPPQDDTVADQNILSVYLFHVIEDQFAKNLLAQQIQGDTPLALAPLCLVLNYVVTARVPAAANAGDRALREQLLIGEAAAAVHDHPKLTDATQFPPNVPIFQSAGISGDDNEIKLTLRPVGIDESINFWSAEEDLTARLSLFFEARLVLLRAPRATRVPGIVLSVGNFVFAGGGPRLNESVSVVGFPLPAGVGPPNPPDPFQRLRASPARVSLFGAGAPPASVAPENNVLVLKGDGLTGERAFLQLTGIMRIEAGPVALATARVALDRSATNSAWDIRNTGSEVRMSIQATMEDVLDRIITILPGIFRLSVVTANQRSLAPGAGLVEETSNELIVSVAPQVVAVQPTGGPPSERAFTIQLFGSYLDDALDVSLDVGGRVLLRAAGPEAGEFDFTTGTGAVDFAVDTTGLASPLPVRLRINGADSTPAWAVF